MSKADFVHTVTVGGKVVSMPASGVTCESGSLDVSTSEGAVDTCACAVPGFEVSSVAAGLKKNGEDDLVLIYIPQGAHVAAVFTQSQVVSAPVLVSRKHVEDNKAHAVIINAGNANACTGRQGLRVARKMCQQTARRLDLKTREVLIASTGVIGVDLPLEKVTSHLDGLVDTRSSQADAIELAADAIRTTDLVSKIASISVPVEGAYYHVCGFAKGSGMIAPNMATALGFVLTDAPLSVEACQQIWDEVVNESFNCVTVDGDTSTNDTAMLLSSGATLYGSEIGVDDAVYEQIKDAIKQVCVSLATSIARDGEGATKLVTIEVTGAPSDTDAKTVAMTIGNSPLVKTALFGNDANWGRIAMAAGRAGIPFDQERISITLAGIEVCKDGTAVPFDEDAAFAALDQSEVCVDVDLGAGEGHARIWTCDLSYDYVRINGEYRS